MQTSPCSLPRVLAKGFVLQDTELAVLVWEEPVCSLQSVTLVLNGVPGPEPEGSIACKMPNPHVWGEGGKKMQIFQPAKS